MAQPRRSSREKFEEVKEKITWGMIKVAMYVAIPFIPLALRLTMGTEEDIARREKEARKKFFAAHPELAPEKWGISAERYMPEMLVEAISEIDTLLTARATTLKTPPARFEFNEKGSVTIEGAEYINSAEVNYFIAVILQHWPTKKPTDEDNEKMLKNGYDFETTHNVCKWLVAAVAVAPDLMPDYTGAPIPDSNPSAIRFTPKKRWRADRMHGWK